MNHSPLDEDDLAETDSAAETLLAVIQQAGRADKALVKALPGYSRSRLQQLITQGHVVHEATGAAIASVSANLVAGMRLLIHVPPVEALTLLPEAIPLDIVYEDEDLLVVNKPAGMSVHPSPGHPTGTLVHALLHHCGASLSGIGGIARPGIVHRIDKDTTGLLVVAKNDATHQHLSAQLADRTLSRRYAALVWGTPKSTKGTVDAPIGRHPKLRQEMAVVATGKPAVTHYILREAFADRRVSLVECKLETGRTHQIRVHMKHLGHPLVGDLTYGGRPPRFAPEEAIAFPRQALHAFEMTFVHPRLNKPLRCTTPLPADMQSLMAALHTSP